MRKHILPRLRSLLSATGAVLLIGKGQAKPPKHDLEPDSRSPQSASDAWLFDSENALETECSQLSAEMTSIANSLSDLRETLALINGETPFPLEATTQRPCAIVHHDDALFDGEVDAPFIPAQEEVSGGEAAFLFGDAPSFQDEMQEHQRHAA